MTNADSIQANSLTIITVWDNHLSNMTRNLYSVSQMKKSPSKTTTFKLFLQKSSPIDFLLGSKSCFWQYYQKSSHLKVISSGL